MVPSVDSPQRHPKSVLLWPADIVAAAAAVDSGTSVTTDVFTTLDMPCTVAFTTPLTSVWTALTYFVCCEAVRISQPQPSAIGGVVGPD